MSYENSYMYVAYVEGDDAGTVVDTGTRFDAERAYNVLKDRGFLIIDDPEEVVEDYDYEITNQGFTILEVSL